jgi:hypothetical protein
MKRYTLGLYVFLLSACGAERFAPSYQLELPPIPPAWSSLLGSPQWELVWIDPEGRRQTSVFDETQVPAIQVLGEWTNPVIAYPFWPHRGIRPAVMEPAGGLFPFDVAGDRIRLSWRGGVEATLYLELAVQHGKSPRQPQYFNWPRFRELLESSDLHETVRKDPWSADWKTIASKIAQSGFDRRRLVPAPRVALAVPLNYEGPWIGTSPFADPLYQEPGRNLNLLVGDQPDTYLSAAGVLRCTKGAWMFLPWDALTP